MSLTKITNRLVGSSLKTAISGSDIAESSSFSTRTTALESDSGSFSTRTTALESDSGSFSTRTTTVEGRVNQGVKTTDSPTFAGATINGTLTASEIHTTFVSSSVATITGSNVFGDAVGDLHSFTGSVSISGSQTSLVTAGNVDFNGNLDVDGTLTVDGGNIVFNEDSADQDFRVESNGNTHMLFVDGGNNRVGIGSSSPAGLIDVMGDSGYAYFTTTSPAAFNMIFRSGSADPQNNWLGQIEFTGASGGRSQIVTRNSTTLSLGSNNVQTLHITDNDYVGIGTNNPAVKLDVNGSALVGRDRDIGSYASDDFDLMVTNANNDATAILLYNDAGAYQSSLIEYYQNKLSLGLNNSNSDDTLLTTTAINITSTGVGIGTDSPTTKFEVYDGSSGADFTTVEYDYNSKNRKLRFGIAGGNPSIQGTLTNDSATSLAINPGGGSVGIGTATPSYKFTVKSGGEGSIANSGIVLENNDDTNVAAAIFEENTSPTSGELRLYSGGAEKVYLRANSSSTNAFLLKGGIMQDITANNTGIQFRLNADTTFINRIDNNFDGASAASSYMRVKVASAANSQNTVLTMYGDGSARCEGNFTSAGGVVDGDSGLKTQQAEFKRLTSNSFSNGNLHDLTQVHQRPFIVKVEDSAGGLSTMGFPIGGSGIAYNWSLFDSDSNAWTSNQATITSTGTNGNTYHFTFNSGSGVLRIQRTNGSLSFTVRVYQIAE